jgi:DNA-binding transcriptional regulator GbsR (MarR family)
MADEHQDEHNARESKPNAAHHPALRSVHDSMLDGLGQLADYFGFSKVMGQLYGTLLMHNGPLSLDELMERLDISKASVSMNMRSLELLGMVRQVWVRGRGGRRKFYEAETNFWQIITNILNGREMRDVERAITVMEDNGVRLMQCMAEMSAEDQAIAQVYIERMAQMQIVFRFAQLVMTNILAQVSNTDVTQVSRIEIQ